MTEPNAEPATLERRPANRALAWIREHHWAIQPEALQTIAEIASREHEIDLEAIAARTGKPVQGLRSVEMRGDVAILSITGPIFRYGNLFTQISGATSLERIALDFGAVRDDPTVSGIILHMDTPGGEVSGIHEFARMVFEARSTKPVWAYVSDKAASAGYFIAAAAERIVIDATGAVGSIGVIARVVTTDNKNVVEVVSQQSPAKRPDLKTEAGRGLIQKHVDRLAQVFVESVAEFRGVDPETVLAQFGQGGLLVGTDSIKAGMADELGSLESTIAGISGYSQENRRMTTQATAPEITREFIADKHPAIAKAFREEGHKSGVEEGASAERTRIQGVLAKSRPGHEKLVQTLAFDGKTQPDQAAAQVLDAMGAADKQRLEGIEKDGAAARASASVVDTAASTDAAKKPEKNAHQVAARAQEIIAEKRAKGITINAAEAVAIAEKEA